MIFDFLLALWFGILTSISPCPLATNIAAISFLSKKVHDSKIVFFSSLAYIFGRMLTYSFIGVVIILSFASIPSTAQFLQTYMNKFLGPILIIVGLFLIDVIHFKIDSFSVFDEKKKKLADSGVLGSFFLGILFSLSFCPIATALFFGSLIPLALKSKWGFIHSLIFGIGTGIPVAIFSVAIVFGFKSFSKWFSKVEKIERWTRNITGLIFIFVGIYFVWAYILLNFFN